MTSKSLLVALALVVSLLAAGGPNASRSTASTPRPGPSVRVAVANVHEGSLVRRPVDQRAGADRRAFAQRVLGRPGRAPDLVVLQEVLGSAGRMADAMNAHQRARNRDARYDVVTGTGHRTTSGRCDGSRSGRFSLVRSSSVLVNRKTVTDVRARGTIRTWGRWSKVARPVTGRQGHGCTEHPWVRVTVRTPDGPRSARVLSAHVAPLGRGLKTRAIGVLRRQLGALHGATATDAVVLAGDLNLNRCRVPLRRGEPERCRLREAHRGLLAAGYRDAVRNRHETGPSGVVGVARRIDFLYSRGAPSSVWWDRCYQAYLVRRWKCRDRSVFAVKQVFRDCQLRSLRHGRPGGGCPPRMFRRYYSDHPVLLGTIG